MTNEAVEMIRAALAAGNHLSPAAGRRLLKAYDRAAVENARLLADGTRLMTERTKLRSAIGAINRETAHGGSLVTIKLYCEQALSDGSGGAAGGKQPSGEAPPRPPPNSEGATDEEDTRG